MVRKKRAKKSTARKANSDINTILFQNKKKILTQDQEFEILKLIIDKFLWVGFFLMAVGLLIMVFSVQNLSQGFSLVIIGAIVLVLLMILVVRDIEIRRK